MARTILTNEVTTWIDYIISVYGDDHRLKADLEIAKTKWIEKRGERGRFYE